MKSAERRQSSGLGSQMRLLLYFVRAYPRRTIIMLGCLLLAALAEGVGLSGVLPLLSLATRMSAGDAASAGNHAPSRLELGVANALGAIGLPPSIGLLLLLIVCGMALKSALTLLAQNQIGYNVAQVATDLRLSLIRALLAARWEYYVRQPVGVFVNAFSTEASRAAQAYLYSATIVTLLIHALLYMTLAMAVSWQVMLAAATTGMLIAFGLKRLVRQARKAGLKQTTLLKTLIAQLADVLFSVKPIKAMAREGFMGPLLETETKRLNRALQRETTSKETLKALQEPLLVSALAAGLYVALTRWGLPLDALILLALLFTRTLTCLNKIQKEYQSLVVCESAFWSLQATIARASGESETALGDEKPRLTRAITLRDVHFAYDERPVLSGASLSIPVGQVTAIVGPSGAGKTSVIDLIVGLVRPRSGEVWIDETPLSKVNVKAWRQIVGYVAQETFLLHESVFVNVTLGEPTLTESHVETALRSAGVWEFVAGMPQGMHTPVGERGSAISGGQRQRIAIARALVHQPQMLILDEATNSLDPESEEAICATVRQLRGTMTILAVSHQPALLGEADRVYRLENGTMQVVREQRPTTRVEHVA